MIISHAHKFIFFAIPKTGTHAIRIALRKHLAPGDEEQVQLFGQSRLSYGDLARLAHGHLGWREIAPAVGPAIWESYFKFAFVRNPWDRFVSYCAFMHRETGLFASDPHAAMARVLANPEHRRRVLFRPQCSFICDEAGAAKIDHVGRHETLQQDFDSVSDRLGLPRESLTRINASERGDYSRYYDDDLKARVGALYAEDIAAFGYEF